MRTWRWPWSVNDFSRTAPAIAADMYPDCRFEIHPHKYTLNGIPVSDGTTISELFKHLMSQHRALVNSIEISATNSRSELNLRSSRERKTARTKTIFICHASEDKVGLARPLAVALIGRGFKVWYDDFTLRLGDSLRRRIEHGLAKCMYGVVILSPSFFLKEWPQRELDSLTAREVGERKKLILPVWHGIDVDEIAGVAPNLADKVGIKTDVGIDRLAQAIERAAMDM